MKRFRQIGFLFALLALTSAALGCPVCGTPNEESRVAYYTTTAIMSFLPLCLIGGMIYYVVKKSR